MLRASVILACVTILPAWAANSLRIRTLSNEPDKVSGGDVLVRVDVPEEIRLDNIIIKRNGQDVTREFRPLSHSFLGVVTGLHLGQNWLEAISSAGSSVQLTLTNFAITGPVFSGPQQQPFVCETQNFKLPDGRLLGPPLDANCSVQTVVTYMYRTAGGDGPALKPLPPGSTLPPDVASTTTINGEKVPYVVRIETGTINRAIYQTAVLHDPTAEPQPSPLTPPKAWNQRLLYSFGGGCTGGWYRQGASLSSLINDNIVGKGYAEAASTLNVFGTNCQDVTAAETMMMVKERFIETYGPPVFTFGRGGSGGSYQQIQIADGYPGLLDGIIPSATFPDVLETTQFLVDAQLLANYFETAGPSLSEQQQLAISGCRNHKQHHWDRSRSRPN